MVSGSVFIQVCTVDADLINPDLLVGRSHGISAEALEGLKRIKVICREAKDLELSLWSCRIK